MITQTRVPVVKTTVARIISHARDNTAERSSLARMNATDPAADWQNSAVFYKQAGHLVGASHTYSPRELAASIAVALWARNHTPASTALSVRVLGKDAVPYTSFGVSLNNLATNMRLSKNLQHPDDLPAGFLKRVAVLGTSGTVSQLHNGLAHLIDLVENSLTKDGRLLGVDYAVLATDLSNVITGDLSIQRDVLARWNRDFWRTPATAQEDAATG